MSTPLAKRRRLDEASKTLHKPFKSPFRTPVKPIVGSDPPSSDPPDPKAPEPANVTSTPAPNIAKGPVPHLANAATPSLSRPKLNPATRKSGTRTPSKPSLTREIMQLRNDIHILNQAHALVTSSKEQDMLVLIDRWKAASRAAAEEVFATTRDRVNRMGGVGAWQEREREQKEWRMKADREEMEAERGRLEEAKENGEIAEETFEEYERAHESEKLNDADEAETFKAAPDDSFTMDMMLKTLNIDLELIGYNKELQRWDG
ncbi:hypothetical protein DM02DRAFT_81399 [Periconia macrospinosa]|uniref:DNA repair protein Dds20/Mei5 n=1 Tax=Periconia macrospinosa TaxID=97972 RepID=A0A2V1DH30_9PLEO|nr:hypothetical protein DM02DRAFT_81399 [Periconia macrospinosa]